VAQLFAARTASARHEVEALLGEDVTYWDAQRGTVSGREAVAGALVAPDGMTLEALTAGSDAAVAEILSRGRGSEVHRRTEVYEIGDGALAACRAYLDPDVAAPL
jgi:ketosteroid isomerase-like protein